MEIYVIYDSENNWVLGAYSTIEKAWAAAKAHLLWTGTLPKDADEQEIEDALTEYYSVTKYELDYIGY